MAATSQASARGVILVAINSSPRGARPVRLLAVHTAEGARTAHDLLAFFHRSTNASSHAIIDHDTTLHILDYGRAAWTLRSGNPISDNLEICAFADWSRNDWLSTDAVDGCANPRAMLHRVADWLRWRAEVRRIPKVKLTPAQVRNGQSGIIGHVDWTEGMDDGTHWDPGPGFPWDYVMELVNETAPSEQDEDMITAPAGTNEHINLIVAGKSKLYVACSWKQHVRVHDMFFYGDTPAGKSGGAWKGGHSDWTFQENRPGPVAIPKGAAMCTIRYTAKHSFGVGAV